MDNTAQGFTSRSVFGAREGSRFLEFLSFFPETQMVVVPVEKTSQRLLWEISSGTILPDRAQRLPSPGPGNVADVGLRFRARKFSGQIEWDLKPALIIGEILGLLCAADDVLGKLLGQQEQGAKINGVVECEPALSLRFEFGRGNHKIVGAGFAVADGCRSFQLLEFGVLRTEDCRVFVSDIGRNEVDRTGNCGRTGQNALGQIDVKQRSVDHLGFALSFEGLLNGIPFFACPGDVEIHIDESPDILRC